MHELSQGELDSLEAALLMWRFLLCHRHRLPDNRRLALIARHGVLVRGSEP